MRTLITGPSSVVRVMMTHGEPLGDPGVLGVGLGWPRGRPDYKIHDFAKTIAYFNGSQVPGASISGVGGTCGTLY